MLTDSNVPKEMIETPALLLDHELLQKNIQKMADYFAGRQAKLRPHTKVHKCPEIAKLQIEAGARGITCQTLGEAETMAKAGIDDILVSNEIVGDTKIERLMNLSDEAHIIVAVENLENIWRLARAAQRRDRTQDVLLDIDVGFLQCGIPPGEPALDIARQVMEQRGLRLRGIMVYEGLAGYKKLEDGRFSPVRSFEDRKTRCIDRLRQSIETRDLLEAHGIKVDIVSAGATHSYNITGDYPGITEIQAGSYVFMDTSYALFEGVGFHQSLTVLTTIISRHGDTAVVDAGAKSIYGTLGMPKVKGAEGIEVNFLRAEHGFLKINEAYPNLKVGDKIELIPAWADWTVNLHDQYFVVREGRLEKVWKVAGRGKSQ